MTTSHLKLQTDTSHKFIQSQHLRASYMKLSARSGNSQPSSLRADPITGASFRAFLRSRREIGEESST